tara:strand:- start:237 stop:479 length:243 start_codon:yes stop_codon:yes gene_type:complete
MDALRLIPHVHSVTVLSEGVEQNGIEYNEIQQLLTNKKKISLIGKNGCAIFFSNKSSILMIQSEPYVNLGAIDLVLDSIE